MVASIVTMGAISENRAGSVYGHWDAMAATYRIWEHYGTTRESLEPFISDIDAPILVIGTGAGAIQFELNLSGRQAFGVDPSRQMLAVARNKRRQQVVRALGQQLPLGKETFNTVVVTTGVLETDPADPRSLIFDEVDRVLKTGGRLIASTIHPAAEVIDAGREIGIVVGNTMQMRRHYEIWRTGNQTNRLVDLIIRWRQVKRSEAHRIVVKHGKLLSAVVSGYDRLAEAAGRENLDPEGYLRRCTDYAINSWDIRKYQQLLNRYGRRIVRFHEEPKKNVITFLAR
jgi:ubiquinone/menaquinone biosynthesis C-methylase UbiE